MDGRTLAFVDYRPSTAWPVVLAAPHGGDARPASVHDRTSGCCEKDWLSIELAQEVRDAFAGAAASPAGAPAYVALTMHRQKLDANRPLVSACEGANVAESEATRAWADYHRSLERALHDCVQAFGFALLLDVHGQSHRPDVTELGYLITSTDLLQVCVRAWRIAPPCIASGHCMRNSSNFLCVQRSCE